VSAPSPPPSGMAAVEIVDTLEFLLGHWTVERTVDDHRGGAAYRFSGTARVTRVPTGATYHESGQVSTAAHRGPARRTLGLSRHADGSVRLDFADGRPFLNLDLSTGVWAGTHPCRADRYEVSFAVLGADALAERWRVTGPDKDYRARTVWRRRRD
jgi:hypothetical protein